MDPLVIIGSGLAGYTLAREWRRLVPEEPLVLVSRDGGDFYSKPMLSAALAAGKTAATLATASAEAMSEQLSAEIRPRCAVTALDPRGRRLVLDGGELRYSRLVLAVGADPIRLALAGDAAERVVSVNDLDDYGRFRRALEGRRRILVLGAGLIGCEFANDLAGAGYAVTIADPAGWPLSRLVPEPAGVALRDRLAAIGVRWHLGVGAESVARAGEALRVRLADGVEIQSDVVLSAVGLRPRTALAAAGGLAVSRGIQVGRDLRSSDPSVFALGDCAEVDGLVLPYVMPIMHAARALARTLSGTPSPVAYPPMPVVVKTPTWPTVVAPPPLGHPGEWATEVTPTGVRALFQSRDGVLLGFALSGDRTPEKNTLTRDLPPVLP